MKKMFSGLTLVAALFLTGCGSEGDYVMEPVDEAQEAQELEDYEAIMKKEMAGGGVPGGAKAGGTPAPSTGEGEGEAPTDE